MRCYRRLTMEEREEMSRWLVQGVGVREVARQLGREASTISREMRQGSCNRWTYRAVRADRRARRYARGRKVGKRKLFRHAALAEVVRMRLRLRWSPEQIAEWLKREYATDPTMQVSPETIYTYLYVLPRGQLKQELLQALRRGHKRRRHRRLERGVQRAPLKDMLSIEERPIEVADRTVPGHWEGDLVIGRYRQSALGTLVERTTRTTLLVPLKSKRAEEVRRAFGREIRRLPGQMRLTLTYDQGREMAQHKRLTHDTQMQVYFAHPRSPWERGTNENTNGLLRQFFPKGTNFNRISRREIKRVQDLLNDRPRKVLGWKTPCKAMQELLQ